MLENVYIQPDMRCALAMSNYFNFLNSHQGVDLFTTYKIVHGLFTLPFTFQMIFLSRHRSAETQCWMRRYVVRTYVRGTWYVRRFSQCARASAACMLYTLNRVSNVFITCK